MGKLKQIKEILKKVKSGVQKLKNIDPELLKEVLKQQLKQKILVPIINFGIGIGSKVVLGCLLIGVILLVFAGLMELVQMMLAALEGFVNSVQYVFMGTAADVDADDIKGVKQQLADMGVDFNEIGYIGAIEKMGGVDSAVDYRGKLTRDIKDGLIEDFTWIDNTATDEEIKKYQDERLTFYIKAYLTAQSQTGASRNPWTFSSDQGAVQVKYTNNLNADTSLAAQFSAWLTDSYNIDFRDGKFYTIFAAGNKEIDVTEQMYQVYMPWQYPFTFHNETQSPDIGYLVSKLYKYHKLKMLIDKDEILIVRMNEEGEYSVKWLDDMEYTKAEIGGTYKTIKKEPMVLVDEVTTWSSTYKYKYHYSGHSNKFADIIEYNTDGLNSKFNRKKTGTDLESLFEPIDSDSDGSYDYVKYTPTGENIENIGFEFLGWSGSDTSAPDNNPKTYYCRFTLEGEENGDEEIEEIRNDDGYNEMKSILLPYPTFDEKGEITNDDDVPRYYISNATEEDDAGNYTGEPKPLNIKTNAEAIIQGVDEIYRIEKTSPEVLAGPEKDSAPINGDKFEEMMETSAPFKPDMSVKMVADIVTFFNDNGVVDISTYFGNGMDGLYANMDAVWFLDAEPDEISVTYSGDTATFTGNAGTVVYSPITGEVEDIIDGEIHLIKYGTYDEAVAEGLTPEEGATKVPLMRIIIDNVSNISVTKGQQVTAGSTQIGVIPDEFDEGGTRKGKITYEHIDGAGTVVNPRDEIDTMIKIEKLGFALPLPAANTTVTSWFGPRNPPAYGASNWHKGIDLAATNGTEIYAIADGVAGSGYDPGRDGKGGYGNWVWIEHEGGYRSEYGHMSSIYKRGGEVKKGDLIGFVGSTGASSGPHLHLTIKNSAISRDLDGNGTMESHINPLEEAGLNVFYGSTQSNY